jgi:hypothetical protein
MTQAERIARHDAERARFGEQFGRAYAAWLDAQPRTPRVAWAPPVSNDNSVMAGLEAPANDNHREAA